jgi:hypothetical protein
MAKDSLTETRTKGRIPGRRQLHFNLNNHKCEIKALGATGEFCCVAYSLVLSQVNFMGQGQ